MKNEDGRTADGENYQDLEQQLDLNSNKENEFEFAKPSAPIYRSAFRAGKRLRPTSAPPELVVYSYIFILDHLNSLPSYIHVPVLFFITLIPVLF